MFIQTESTPNPATLKFLPGLTVLNEGSAHFDTREEAKTISQTMLFRCFPEDRVQKQDFRIGFNLFSSGLLTKIMSQTMTFQ